MTDPDLSALEVRFRERELRGCNWMEATRHKIDDALRAIDQLDAEGLAREYPREMTRSYWALRQSVDVLQSIAASLRGHLPAHDDLIAGTEGAIERLQNARTEANSRD